jgi:hypothetical protein
MSHDLRLRAEASLLETAGCKRGEQLVRLVTRDDPRKQAPDLRCQHEAVSAEAGGDIEALATGNRTERRLVVGRHVVESFHEQR